MIKRELHTAITNKDIEEIIDNMTGKTKIVSHVVDNYGTHCIITEREVVDNEHTAFMVAELENEIARCNKFYEERIRRIEQYMHQAYEATQFEIVKEYEQDKTDAIREYRSEQTRLQNKLEKLKHS